jgi:hypothetical protein
MRLQSNFKKPSFIALIIVSILVGVGLPTLAYSTRGKELYADIWLHVIMPFFLLVFYIFILAATWKKSSKNRRIFLILFTVAIAWVAFSSLSLNWPLLPWGRMGAIETANNFMQDLKNADFLSAFEKLSPITQKHMTPDSLNQLNSKPVSWKLENIDRDSVVIGNAKFPDGVELPVEIRMRWLDHEWKIYGVQFGEWEKDSNGNVKITTRLDFLFCCDGYGIIFDTIFSLGDKDNPFGFNQSR